MSAPTSAPVTERSVVAKFTPRTVTSCVDDPAALLPRVWDTTGLSKLNVPFNVPTTAAIVTAIVPFCPTPLSEWHFMDVADAHAFDLHIVLPSLRVGDA